MEVCQRIHGHITGSDDALSEDELKSLADWLARRVTAWRNYQTGHASLIDYDHAVRLLAKATLEMVAADPRSF